MNKLLTIPLYWKQNMLTFYKYNNSKKTAFTRTTANHRFPTNILSNSRLYVSHDTGVRSREDVVNVKFSVLLNTNV